VGIQYCTEELFVGDVKRVDVLDHGYVELIDQMGDDFRILEAARMSTGADARKGDEKDRKLIRYLYTMGHNSPVEQVLFTFKLKMPLFVIQQNLRHRTARLNQSSARYQAFEWEVYFPEEWRIQDTKNKQGSLDVFSDKDGEEITEGLNLAYDEAEFFYMESLRKGVAREQARTAMPVGQYSEMIWNMDLHNLFHFLELRDHPHAQYEIRVYAQAILKLLHEYGNIPWALEIFEQVRKVRYAVQAKMRGLEDFDRFVEYIEAFEK
jgi:thymidylate synthase (FAD)